MQAKYLKCIRCKPYCMHKKSCTSVQKEIFYQSEEEKKLSKYLKSEKIQICLKTLSQMCTI